MFIISVGFVKGGIAPILTSEFNNNGLLFVDPLPSALVLTAIVIGVGTTALGLALAKNMYQKYGTFELDEMGEEFEYVRYGGVWKDFLDNLDFKI